MASWSSILSGYGGSGTPLRPGAPAAHTSCSSSCARYLPTKSCVQNLYTRPRCRVLADHIDTKKAQSLCARHHDRANDSLIVLRLVHATQLSRDVQACVRPTLGPESAMYTRGGGGAKRRRFCMHYILLMRVRETEDTGRVTLKRAAHSRT